MSALLAWLSARNKAFMALVAGVLNWGYFVVDSKSSAVTAKEWLLLAGIGAAAVGVHQISNSATTVDPQAALDAVLAKVGDSLQSLRPVPSPVSGSVIGGTVIPASYPPELDPVPAAEAGA